MSAVVAGNGAIGVDTRHGGVPQTACTFVALMSVSNGRPVQPFNNTITILHEPAHRAASLITFLQPVSTPNQLPLGRRGTMPIGVKV